MTRTVLACPACDSDVNTDRNRRAYCDGGRPTTPDERWKCRECGHTFARPTERPPKVASR